MAQSVQLCDHCHKKPATYTMLCEIGFGVEVKVGQVCASCKRKIQRQRP